MQLDIAKLFNRIHRPTGFSHRCEWAMLVLTRLCAMVVLHRS